MLPNEILSIIIHEVDVDTLMNFRLVSKYCSHIASNPELWCRLICTTTSYTQKTFCYSKKQCDDFYNNNNLNDYNYYISANVKEPKPLKFDFERRKVAGWKPKQ